MRSNKRLLLSGSRFVASSGNSSLVNAAPRQQNHGTLGRQTGRHIAKCTCTVCSAMFLATFIGLQAALHQDGVVTRDGDREVLILSAGDLEDTATFQISALGDVRMLTSRGWTARAGNFATTPARLFLPPGAEALLEAQADRPAVVLQFGTGIGDTITTIGRRLRVRQDSVSRVLMVFEATAEAAGVPQ